MESSSHEMMGPDIIEKMQEFFKQNPDKYAQFIKAQKTMQLEKEEKEKLALDPKERLAIARNNLRSKRMTKHMHKIISKKEEEKDKEKETNIQNEKDEEETKAKLELENKEMRLKIKREKKYKKKKDKKNKEDFEKEFEIVSKDA